MRDKFFKHKKTPVTCVTFGFLFFLFLCYETVFANTITVSGVVQDFSGNRIQGATVSLLDNPSISTTTGSDGSFTLQGVPSGVNFYLKASKEGFKDTYTVAYKRTSNIILGPPIQLVPESAFNSWNVQSGKGVIIGNVGDDTGPIQGAIVSATGTTRSYDVQYTSGPLGPVIPGATSTNETGWFRILNVDNNDTITVTVQKEGLSFYPALVRGVANAVSHARFIRSVSYSGRVTWKGAPVQGAIVSVVRGDPSWSATTDDAGFFTLNVPARLDIYLKAEKEGYRTTYGPKLNLIKDTVSPGLVMFKEEDLSNWGLNTGKGAIIGLIYSKRSIVQGHIEGAAIQIQSENGYAYSPLYLESLYGPVLTGANSTNTNGSYRIINAEPGDTVTVTASKSGWSFNQTVVSIFPDGISQAMVGGDDNQSISFTGAVVDNNLSPVSGAKVNVWFGDPENYVITGSDGLFRIENLPKGVTFSLEMKKEGYVPIYTSNIKTTTDVMGRWPFVFYTSLTPFGIQPGKGMIRGVVRDGSFARLAGAQVTYTSSKYPSNPPYQIKYENESGELVAGSGTFSNGTFYILNVEDDDDVTVSVQKTGYTFPQRVFTTHANAVSQANIQAQYPYSISGYVKDIYGNPVRGTSVIVKDDNGNIITDAATDYLGYYSLPISNPGIFKNFYVEKTGYELISAPPTPIEISDQNKNVSNINFLLGPVEERITLKTGWNFISFFKLPSNTSISSIMAQKNVRIIWGFNNQTKEWLKWKPAGSDNALTNFEFGKGYWIYMDSDDFIDISTWSLRTSTSITLYPGWNLIGWLGDDGKSVGEALSNLGSNWKILWTWDNGQWSVKYTTQIPGYQSINNLYRNKAYWINVKNQTSWEQ